MHRAVESIAHRDTLDESYAIRAIPGNRSMRLAMLAQYPIVFIKGGMWSRLSLHHLICWMRDDAKMPRLRSGLGAGGETSEAIRVSAPVAPMGDDGHRPYEGPCHPSRIIRIPYEGRPKDPSTRMRLAALVAPARDDGCFLCDESWFRVFIRSDDPVRCWTVASRWRGGDLSA